MRLTKKKIRERVLEMRSGKYLPINENKKWKKKDINLLVNKYVNGIGISELAVILERSEEAINQEITNLRINETAKNHRSRRSKASEIKCLCNICKVKDSNGRIYCPYLSECDIFISEPN